MNTEYAKQINILIFGCGLIGFRHLESFLKSKYNLNIYVVEKNSKRILELKNIIQNNKQNKIKIFFYKKIIDFKTPFYLGIVATNSSERLDSLKNLLKKNIIEYLILEKLLSSNLSDLKKIKNFINKKQTNIYVNTPRRFMKVYRDIKKLIHKNDLVSINFTGSGWNFASNTIHFIDLFAFLSGNHNLKKGSVRILDKIKSKRSGYSEFYGSMYLYNDDGAVLELSDFKQKSIPSLVIQTKKYKFVIYETYGIYFQISIKNSQDIKINKFKIEYQSTLTYQYLDCLYKNKSLNLPTFDESYLQHLIFYELFFNQIENKSLQNIQIS